MDKYITHLSSRSRVGFPMGCASLVTWPVIRCPQSRGLAYRLEEESHVGFVQLNKGLLRQGGVREGRIHLHSFRASFPSDKTWEPRSWAISWGKRGDRGYGKRFPEMPLDWEACTR